MISSTGNSSTKRTGELSEHIWISNMDRIDILTTRAKMKGNIDWKAAN